MLNANDRLVYHGREMNRRCKAALAQAEDDLGYELTIFQGGFRPVTSFSGSTHTGGGVVDLSAWHWQEKSRALFDAGFVPFHRTEADGDWEEHIHCVLAGDPTLAASSAAQVESWKNGRSGLVSNGPFKGVRYVKFSKNFHTFDWPQKPKKVPLGPGERVHTIISRTHSHEEPDFDSEPVNLLTRGKEKTFKAKIRHGDIHWFQTEEGNWVANTKTRPGRGLPKRDSTD